MRPLTKIYCLRFALGIIAALICVGYALATGLVYTNLVVNRSVEAGNAQPQDWSSSGTVTDWTTAYARAGSRSLQINVTGGSAEWNGTVKPVQAGYTYQVSGWFRGEIDSGQFILGIRWFSDTEGNAAIGQDNVSISIGTTSRWMWMQGTFTAPTGARSSQVVFSAVGGTGDVYGDDFEVRQPETWTKLLNGISLALVTYIVSYYLIRTHFASQVEKKRKILSTGIGVYFLAWIIFWVLLYTLLATYL